VKRGHTEAKGTMELKGPMETKAYSSKAAHRESSSFTAMPEWL